MINDNQYQKEYYNPYQVNYGNNTLPEESNNKYKVFTTKKTEYTKPDKQSFGNKEFFRQGFTKPAYVQNEVLSWKNRYRNDFYFDHSEYEKSLKEHIFHLNNKKSFNFDKLMSAEIFVYEKNELITTNTCKTFNDLKLNSQLIENLSAMQFNEMTPIQKTVIPLIIDKYDIMGCAQTGSGKTIAFLLPCINKMLTEGPPAVNMNNCKFTI